MAEVFKALGEKDPRQIAGYRLAAKLGSGGMGKVYLSYTPAGRPVAIKVVRPDLSEDPEFRDRFRREVAAARRVHGLYTAPVIDAETEGDTPWLATAYVPGPSLQSVITDHGPLPVPTVLLLIAGMAEALAAVHEAGIVHRDFKPSNVLLAADGPRVIDFGISRAADASSLTGSGMTIGTPAFMAPEQAEATEITPATDIFALGQVACFAASGAPAFGDGTPHGVLYRVVHKEPDLSGVPEELRELIGRCLAKEAADRPTPAEVIAMCRAASPGAELRRPEDWLPTVVAADLGQRSASPAPAGVSPHDETLARARDADASGHQGAADGAAAPARGAFDPARRGPTTGHPNTPDPSALDPSTPEPNAADPGTSGAAASPGRAGQRVAALVAAAVLVVGAGAGAAYYLGKDDDGDSSARRAGESSAPRTPDGEPKGEPSRDASDPAGRGPGDGPSGSGDREGAEPTGVPSGPGSQLPGGISPKGVDYDDVSLPDGYHLTLATDPLRPDDSPATAADFGYRNPAAPGSGGGSVRAGDGGKLVLLRADEYGSATSCRDTTRFTAEIGLGQLAPGSRVCVLAASGDLALVTYQGAAPQGDPSDYISLDVTVWRAGSPRT
ncbi:protein kinase [Streptomyces sp. 71268]|uniref:serine/threonine-protein kinase n=1 Tax=Streptomyces sp. 71268 TaxID=3002640 RepID=UPI0023F6229F|nr:serine/threonine-protein kinase [Streptomyces sp. 71268]WEV24736.1 protein kinase [Streptomyces sp. 71268]